MPSSQTCPEEAELLRLAMEDAVPAELAAHAEGCADCRSRIDRAREELALFRALLAEPQSSPLEGPAASTIRLSVRRDRPYGTDA